MTCAEAEPLIGASLDGELDPHTALQIDQHFATCSTCSTLLARLERLQAEIAATDLDWSIDADLRPLASKIRRQNGESWWRRPWVWRSVLGTVAAALLVMISLPGRLVNSTEQQIVDNHVRSLLADHLVDVPSSDRHTVKPWFQGKLSFAPAVPDLSADGFQLIGGRLDVVAGKPAAALIYKRGQHVINLWISPGNGSDGQVTSTNIEGFHLLHWQKDGMLYWAVSDLNPSELREFAMLIRSH